MQLTAIDCERFEFAPVRTVTWEGSVGGSMILSRRHAPWDIVAAHGDSRVVQSKRLAAGVGVTLTAGRVASVAATEPMRAVASVASPTVTGPELHADGGFTAA